MLKVRLNNFLNRNFYLKNNLDRKEKSANDAMRSLAPKYIMCLDVFSVLGFGENIFKLFPSFLYNREQLVEKNKTHSE